MKFDLVAPCSNCPFRTDIVFHLRTERVEEILDAVLDRGLTFACHKTTEAGGQCNPSKEQHCAGAMILAEHQDRPNQMMRIGERLGFYDREKLRMDSPVFDDPESMIDHYRDINDD